MRSRHFAALGTLAVGLAVAGCGASRAPAPAVEPAPSTPEVELRAPVWGTARVVLRAGSEAFIVVGGMRAHIEGDRVDLAADAFASEIVDVVRLNDESWVFRDALGTVAWSERFIASLRRTEDVVPDRRRSRGSHMSFRGTDGRFRITAGGPLRTLAVPERTLHVAVASADAALAYADGGLLYLTRDGGREWAVIPSDGASPPSLDGSRVVVALDARTLALDPDGQLTDVASSPPRDEGPTQEEIAALAVALTSAGRLIPTRSLGEGRIVVYLAGREHLLSAPPHRYLGVCGDVDCDAPPRARVAEGGAAILLGERRLALPPRWEATSVIAPSADRAIALAVPRDPREQEVLDVVSLRPACGPILDRDAHGAVPLLAQTALAIDAETGRVTPLCALPPDQHVTHVFPRPDGAFFVRIADGASGFLAATGTCDAPHPLPARSVGACFVDDAHGVAFGGDHLGQLWHTADGGASWEPLAVPVDGAADALGGIAPDDVRQEGAACIIGPLVVRRRAARSTHARTVLAPRDAAPRSPAPCPEPHTAALVCRDDGSPPPSGLARGRILSASCARGRCSISASQGGSPSRFTLPIGSCPRGAPDFHAEWLSDDGLLVSCAGTPSCGCAAPAHWVSADGSVTPLEAPVASPDQVLRLPDGGIALLLVDDRGDDRVLHLDAAGGFVASRRFHWREEWPRGLVVREGRPLLAVAAPGLRAIDLYDPADRGPPRARLPIAVRPPSRLCGREDGGPLLGTRYPLLEIVMGGESAVDGATRIVVRAQGEESCLASVALRAAGGDGDLRVEGSELIGVLDHEGSAVGARCRLFHADRN